MTTGGVEVHVNGLGWVFRLEEEKLSDDHVSSVVRNGTVDADNTLLKKTGKDVVGSFPSRGVLDNHRDQAIAASPAPTSANPRPAVCDEFGSRNQAPHHARRRRETERKKEIGDSTKLKL